MQLGKNKALEINNVPQHNEFKKVIKNTHIATVLQKL